MPDAESRVMRTASSPNSLTGCILAALLGLAAVTATLLLYT